MRLPAVAFATSLFAILSGSSLWAAPPPCDAVREALARGSDPAAVAESLRTTRARVNACAKLEESRDRLADRRVRLHEERSERGLD
jgi:hypothetical protein